MPLTKLIFRQAQVSTSVFNLRYRRATLTTLQPSQPSQPSLHHVARQLFDELAKEKGFHPLEEADRWSSVNDSDILSYQVLYLCIHYLFIYYVYPQK